jgi:leucyl aminopeptidase
MVKYSLSNKCSGDIFIYISSNKLNIHKLNPLLKPFKLTNKNLENNISNTLDNKLYILFTEPEEQNELSGLEDIRVSTSDALYSINDIEDKRICIVLLNSAVYDLKASEEMLEAQMLTAMNCMYNFDKYKTDKRPEPTEIVFYCDKIYPKLQNLFKKCKIIGKNADLVRDLGNEPGNMLGPANYANLIKKNAHNYSVRIMKEDELKRLGLNNILSMAKGSVLPARFVIINYNGLRKTHRQAKQSKRRTRSKRGRSKKRNRRRSINKSSEKGPIVLVGKGVTFDAGGINIKGDPEMYQMKTDMLGSAVVYGIIDALARLKVRKHVIGLLPLVENMPGPKAVKPGDVITAYNGKTIEIMDTDAEGRLIMACALAYSKNFNPKYVIDIATLTGQAGTISNDEATIIMSNNDALCKKTKDIGEKEYERVIRLPIYPEHVEQLQSESADVKNVNNDINGADAIIAGAFLKEFVPEGVKWIHLDLCKNYIKDEVKYHPVGCTGIGYRLGLKLVMKL